MAAHGQDAAPAAASGQDSQEARWRPETFTLANGMQVVVIPDHRVPVVTHMVWYRVGAADEPPGKSGIAHFLEHLMFKGTANVPPGLFSKIVARNGGRDNAFTNHDYTAYFQRVALDRLPLVMKLEADRMTGLRLSDEVVYPERDVVLEERSSRIDNNPESLLGEEMAAALFGTHPYGTPIIGWEKEIRSLTTEDALSFYRQYYTPKNAILIIAGDITAAQLRPMAEAFYGHIPAHDMPPRVRPTATPPATPVHIERRDKRVQQPSFRRAYLAPSYATAEPGLAEALDVLGQLLGSGPTSRLYRQLVVERALAASAAAWYTGSALDYGRFGLYVSPRPGVGLKEIEQAVDVVLAALLNEGVSREEVARARSSLIADSIYARDNQQSLAQAYGAGLTTGESVEEITTYPDRVSRVTVEDVNRAARLVLDTRSYVTGYLLPEEGS